MKIGVLIPTQGARPNFLKKAIRYAENQTIKPDVIEVVNDKSGLKIDLTWRYRLGFERIKSRCDMIFIFEDDDFYREDYIEYTLKEWEANGKPEIIGSAITHYYHLLVRKYWKHIHPGRASMYATAITSEAINKINFPADTDIKLDLRVWSQLKGYTYHDKELRTLGIKHGLGITGGIGHRHDHIIYQTKDLENEWLRKIVGQDNVNEYNRIISKRSP